ncbi:6-bladed beta-propeller [Algoriphagus aestuarii]|nr:6-bladed beta-propeller [Algoriphagus aestuarii]
MNNRSFLNLLFLVAFLYSCNGKNADYIGNKKIVELNLDKSNDENFFSDVKNLNYKLFVTDFPDLLVQPFKIINFEKKYLIEDKFNKKIFIFNIDGDDYLTAGVPGQGPGENLDIDDFTLKSDTIIIKDSALGKRLYFNLKGDFLKEEKDTFLRSIFFEGKDFKLYYSHNDPEIGNRIVRVGNDGEVKGYLPIEEWFEKKIHRTNSGFILNKQNGKIYFPLPFTNEIAIFDKNGYLTELVKIDFGKYNLTSRDWLRSNEFMDIVKYSNDNKLVIGFTTFAIVGDKILLYVQQGIDSEHLFLFDFDFNLLKQYDDFENIIDGINLSAIPWGARENKVVYMINSKELYNNINISSHEFKPQLNSNISAFYNEKNNQLFEDEFIVLVEAELAF